MHGINIEQFIRLDSDCPMRVILHPADDLVEVALGESRISDSGLRLLLRDPETCARLRSHVDEACDQLVGHLNARTDPGFASLAAAEGADPGIS
jgi:hypothetical protein